MGITRMNGGEPDVVQEGLNGWSCTWNPDDNRYYVTHPDGSTAATFKELRNARQYMREIAVPVKKD